MTDLDLDALEALEKKATPPPWDGSFMEPDGRYALCAGGPPKPVAPGQDGKWVADWLAEFDWQGADVHGAENRAANEGNAAFVAAARNALPALIARVRALEAEKKAPAAHMLAASERIAALEAALGDVRRWLDADLHEMLDGADEHLAAFLTGIHEKVSAALTGKPAAQEKKP